MPSSVLGHSDLGWQKTSSGIKWLWVRSADLGSVWILIVLFLAFSDLSRQNLVTLQYMFPTTADCGCTKQLTVWMLIWKQRSCSLSGWQTPGDWSIAVFPDRLAALFHRQRDSHTDTEWSLLQVNLVSRKPICAICRPHGLCCCSL